MEFISFLSGWIIPLVILFILLYALYKKVPAYEVFVEGGKDGLKIAKSLLPFLVGMIVSINILRSSGALDAFIQLISPIFIKIGIPPEIIPLALIRPISRSEERRVGTESTSQR